MESTGRYTLPLDPVLEMHMEPNSGYHLADLDFDIVVWSNLSCTKKQTINKSECEFVDVDTFNYRPNTSMIGRGEYYATLIVKIPDGPSIKGYRNLSIVMKAGLNIV